MTERYLLPRSFVTRAFLREVAKEIGYDHTAIFNCLKGATSNDGIKLRFASLCANLYPKIDWNEIAEVEYKVVSDDAVAMFILRFKTSSEYKITVAKL